MPFDPESTASDSESSSSDLESTASDSESSSSDSESSSSDSESSSSDSESRSSDLESTASDSESGSSDLESTASDSESSSSDSESASFDPASIPLDSEAFFFSDKGRDFLSEVEEDLSKSLQVIEHFIGLKSEEMIKFLDANTNAEQTRSLIRRYTIEINRFIDIFIEAFNKKLNSEEGSLTDEEKRNILDQMINILEKKHWIAIFSDALGQGYTELLSFLAEENLLFGEDNITPLAYLIREEIVEEDVLKSDPQIIESIIEAVCESGDVGVFKMLIETSVIASKFFSPESDEESQLLKESIQILVEAYSEESEEDEELPDVKSDLEGLIESADLAGYSDLSSLIEECLDKLDENKTESLDQRAEEGVENTSALSQEIEQQLSNSNKKLPEKIEEEFSESEEELAEKEEDLSGLIEECLEEFDGPKRASMHKTAEKSVKNTLASSSYARFIGGAKRRLPEENDSHEGQKQARTEQQETPTP